MTATIGARLVAEVANQKDPARAAVIFLGRTDNVLTVTLQNRGAEEVAFAAASPDGVPALVEIAFAANVPIAALSAARVSVEVVHVGTGAHGADAAPVDLTFDIERGSVLIRPTDRLVLRQNDALVVTMNDITIPSDYTHVPLLLTIAWQGLALLDPVAPPVTLDPDGRALALLPRTDAKAQGGKSAPLSLGWLAQVGRRTLPSQALGLVIVTPPAPKAQPDKVRLLARASASAADRAHEDIAPMVGGPGYEAAIKTAESAAGLQRAYDHLMTMLPRTPVPAGGEPIVNRLAFRLQNSSAGPLFVDDGSRRRPSFTISMATAETRDDAGAYDALCTAAEASDIQCRIHGDDDGEWGIEQDRAKAQWVLTPRSVDVLGAHEAIVVVLDNLVTTMPAYPTGLYIAHRDLPGYDDGVLLLPVEKVDAAPTVGAFGAFVDGFPLDPVTGVAAGRSVELRWTCWGLPPGYDGAVQLFAEERSDDGSAQVRTIGNRLPSRGSHAETPTADSTTYRLALKVPDAPPDAYVVVRIAPVRLLAGLSDPSIELGESVTLVYTVSGASSEVTIDPPATRAPASAGESMGMGAFVATPTATTSYTLRAEGRGGPAVIALVVDVSDPKSQDQILFLTERAVVNAHAVQVSSGGSPLPGKSMYSGQNQLWDFGRQNDIAHYLIGSVDGTGELQFHPEDLRPAYPTNTDSMARSVVSLLTMSDRAMAATQDFPAVYVGGTLVELSPRRNFDDTREFGKLSFLFGFPEFPNVPFVRDPAPQMKWYAPADSGKILMVRYAREHGLLCLDENARLMRCPDTPAGAGNLIAEKVESFAFDATGPIYWVNMRHELLQATRSGPAADWTSMKLADIPRISTRIACVHGTVYWAENEGRFGPMSCSWAPGEGYRQIRNLPGGVPFNGVTVDLRDFSSEPPKPRLG